MKKTLFITAAAIAAMTSCTKEINNIEPQRLTGETITIKTTMAPETRTAFAGNMKSVEWEASDKMAVVMETGTNTWGHSAEFSKGNGDEFTGTFATPEDGPAETGTNTYYAFYPYDATITTIGLEKEGASRYFFKGEGTKDGNYLFNIAPGTQVGLNNMNHIHVPLYGKGTAEGKAMPEITMTHLAAIFKISIKNPGTEAINIQYLKIANNGNVNMSGGFRLNISGDYPLMGSSSQSHPYAELNVQNGSIAPGATGDFYIMTSRARILKDTGCTEITIEAKTDKDYMIHKIPVDVNTQELIFRPGEIHKTSFEYTGTAYEPVAKVSFETVTPEQNAMNVKVHAIVKNFTYVDDTTTPVGMWYSSDNGATKSYENGKYHGDTGEVTGSSPILTPGNYTFGAWVSIDGTKQLSDGVALTVVDQPYKFPAMTATGEFNKLTVSSKLKTATDPEENVATADVEKCGIWYSTDEGANITEVEMSGYDGTTAVIQAEVQLDYGVNYMVGTYAVIKGKKYISPNFKHKMLKNEVNLNESTVDLTDKNNFNALGYTKIVNINCEGSDYAGIRIGKAGGKKKISSIQFDKTQLSDLTGNVTMEFYAISAVNAAAFKITVEGAGTAEPADITVAGKADYDGGDWIGTPAASDRYTVKLTGITADSIVKFEVKDFAKDVINFWGIRVAATK